MKIIEYLSERISEEIGDANGYAMKALEYRDEYPELAQTLYDLSTEEMGHRPKDHSGGSFGRPVKSVYLRIPSLNVSLRIR